jgi:urease accessory protein
MTPSAARESPVAGPDSGPDSGLASGNGVSGGRFARNRVAASASIEAVAGPGGATRLPVLASQVPLVLRRTPSAVYVVGGAAGPLGGDCLDLRIAVGPGAVLRVRTAAASIALPGLDELESVLRVSVTVGEGGRLEYLPEPVVVAAGARHATLVSVTLAAGAALVLRDEVLLGRHGEAGGTARSVLRVDYAGRPLLRQSLSVSGTDAASLGPAVLAGHRAVGTLLLVNEPEPDEASSAYGASGLHGHAGAAGISRSTGSRETAVLDPKSGASLAVHGGVSRPDRMPSASDREPRSGKMREAQGAGSNPSGADEVRPSLSEAEDGALSRESPSLRAGRVQGVSRRAAAEVAVMPLAGPGVLVTALAHDAVTLRRRLDGTETAAP